MSNELKQSLSLYGLTMVAIGATIGSGIFRTPGEIAYYLSEPSYILGIWALGGLISLMGALTFSEMGSMFPKAGGLYVYLREAYGDGLGFLFGWYILLVSTSGAIAALALVCAEHLNILFPIGEGGLLWVGLALIVLASVINIFGAKQGERFSNIFTGAKLFGILAVIFTGLLFAPGNPAAIEVLDVATYPEKPESLSGCFALAFMSVLWSFGGWQHATFLAGETPNPKRTVPLAMIIGTLTITAVYLLTNVAYMQLLPIESIAEEKLVAALAVQQVIPNGSRLIAALVATSTFGTLGVYCLTAPRIYYAMAKDGIFFKAIAKVHPKYKTPVHAILLQAIWAIVLLFFWGTFSSLILYVTFVDWVGLMLVASTIFIFRKKMPQAERPYKTTLYPLPPLIFIGICLWFIYFVLKNSSEAWYALFVVGVGWLVYWFGFRKK